jgi:ribose 5-phosphate isomerase B
MKIVFASDHAGYDLKCSLIEWLNQQNYEILDFGTYSNDSVDYPDFAIPAAESITTGNADFGVLICGTGIGMCITANKINGILAANCMTPEIAQLAREHNNANVLTLGARFINSETAKQIVKAFIDSEFQGGRHIRRLEKILSLTGC